MTFPVKPNPCIHHRFLVPFIPLLVFRTSDNPSGDLGLRVCQHAVCNVATAHFPQPYCTAAISRSCSGKITAKQPRNFQLRSLRHHVGHRVFPVYSLHKHVFPSQPQSGTTKPFLFPHCWSAHLRLAVNPPPVRPIATNPIFPYHFNFFLATDRLHQECSTPSRFSSSPIPRSLQVRATWRHLSASKNS